MADASPTDGRSLVRPAASPAARAGGEAAHPLATGAAPDARQPPLLRCGLQRAHGQRRRTPRTQRMTERESTWPRRSDQSFQLLFMNFESLNFAYLNII